MGRISKTFYNCIIDYSLIQPGDKILIGLSGGKDSYALLHFLAPLRKKLNFELYAAHILMRENNNEDRIKKLEDFCKKYEVEIFIKPTNILDYIEGLGLKKDICFLCAHHRRKELFMMMEEKKINKIALGHHRNDAIETFLMNIFFSAQTCTMMPKQSLFKKKIEVIRPMYTIREEQIISIAKKEGFPVFGCDCLNSKVSKRKYVKDLIKQLNDENKRIEYNIFTAMHNVNTDYLPIDILNKQKR